MSAMVFRREKILADVMTGPRAFAATMDRVFQ